MPASAELGGYGGSAAKIDIKVRMNHEQEVNRARYCPQDPFLIATKSPSSDVLVYNWSKHPGAPRDREVRPELRLEGHDKEGYGLAWSHVEKGRLVSAGDDKAVCMWEVAAAAEGHAAGGDASVASSSASKTAGEWAMARPVRCVVAAAAQRYMHCFRFANSAAPPDFRTPPSVSL